MPPAIISQILIRPVARSLGRASRTTCVLATFVGALLAATGRADDWLFFRGPNQNGISSESGWSSAWPEEGPKIAWRKELGLGVSSFAVAGNRVLTMGKEANEDIVWCLAADTGEVIWQQRYPCEFDDHNFTGGTSSTPTVADGRVYTLAYDGQVHCWLLESGKRIWRRHLVEDFEGRYSGWDYAGSPLVAQGKVILDTGANGKSTVALEATTGELVWAHGEDLAGYATPVVFQQAGVDGVLVFKARAMVAHRLSSGEELWRIPWKTTYDVNASSPTVIADKLFISSGYGGRRARGALFDLRQSPPASLWVNDEIETKMNSAIVADGYVYCVSEHDGGKLMCVSLEDGRTVWQEERFARFGTLMMADRKLIVLDEMGDLVIVDASADGYRELARATMLEKLCWAMPVLANGRIYARNNSGAVVCIDVRSLALRAE